MPIGGTREATDDNPVVFVSYSHLDKPWLDKLWPFLRQLERHGKLAAFADTDIPTGSDWYGELGARMAQARAAILLVTPNFLASEFCVSEEVPVLLQSERRGRLTLFPLLLDNCNWEAERWLKRLQLKTWGGKPIRKAGANYRDVFTELAQELEHALAPGYQPPGLATAAKWATSEFDLTRMPETGSYLFGREKEASLLDRAWSDPRTNLAVFVAVGGVGKSTLARVWCEMMAEQDWLGAERAFAWSFYSQGTGRMSSSEAFVQRAFEFFGEAIPKGMSQWDQGERLADLVRRRKTLLVLDGLEPLQSDATADRGSVRDPAVRVLLESLAEKNQGLCVVTTREPLRDLDDYAAPAVLQQSLERVSELAGRALLRVRGVQGENAALEGRVTELGGAALAVNLLANALADTPTRHIDAIDLPLLTVPESDGGHARRVMEAWAERLEAGGEYAAVELLHLIGLFDRPAPLVALRHVLDGDALAGVSRHLKRADDGPVLARLRRAGLLDEASSHAPEFLDAHPLVREHFGARLRVTLPKSFTEAHRRLYEFYAASKPHQPDDLTGMEPLFAAVMHGCAAGLVQEACDAIYDERIGRGQEYFLTKKLGAFAADLSCAGYFFEERWTTPSLALTAADQSWLLNQAGHRLRALGRTSEAIGPLRNGHERRVAERNWREASVAAGSLSELHVALGEIAEGEAMAVRAVEHADESRDVGHRILRRTTHADALLRLGRLEGSRALFEEAERMQCALQSEYPILYSLQGYQYCELLLALGEPEAVLRRAFQSLEWAQRDSLLDIALDHLSLGRAALALESAPPERAAENVRRAVDGLRYAGAREFVPPGLFARAELRRRTHDFGAARKDLNEAERIIRRAGLRLFEADLALERAYLLHAEGHDPEARAALERAAQLVEEMSYGLLTPRIEGLRAVLRA